MAKYKSKTNETNWIRIRFTVYHHLLSEVNCYSDFIFKIISTIDAITISASGMMYTRLNWNSGRHKIWSPDKKVTPPEKWSILSYDNNKNKDEIILNPTCNN